MTADLVANLHARTGGNALFLTHAVDAFKRTQTAVHLLKRIFETDDIERFLVKEIDDSLTEAERAVMCAVAVLQGHAGTRDAIEAIADRENVRRTLRELRKRHLLLVTEGEAGREYGMNAIVRYFYYDLLGKRERQAMHRRAGEYYETEEPDVLRAARHYERAGEHERAAVLAAEDVLALISQGQAQALRTLLARFDARQLGPELWARITLARGYVYHRLGERQAARESYQEAFSQLAQLRESPVVQDLRIQVCEGMGDLLQHESPREALDWLRRGLEELAGANGPAEATLHITMGDVLRGMGNYDAAVHSLQRGLDLRPQGPDPWRARALINLGLIYSVKGDLEQAQDHYLRALEISQQLGDRWKMVDIRMNLAMAARIAGEWERAACQYQEALELARQLGGMRQQAQIALNLGVLYTKRGEHELAARHLAHCLEIVDTRGMKVGLVFCRSNLGDLHLRRGDLAAAANALAEAERLALETDTKYLLPEISRRWAEVHLAEGHPQEAQAQIERSLKLAREIELVPEEGMSLRVLAQVLLDNDQPEAAVEAFAQSLSLLEAKDPYEAARTRLEWGRALISEPEAPGSSTRQGITLLQEARATFERLGAQHDLAAVDELLGMQERGRR
jgi:tetratricopeptide (TPR) repeat protein